MIDTLRTRQSHLDAVADMAAPVEPALGTVLPQSAIPRLPGSLSPDSLDVLVRGVWRLVLAIAVVAVALLALSFFIKVADRVRVTALAVPAQRWYVRAQTAGQVTEIRRRVGDSVALGDTIAIIDQLPILSRVAQLEQERLAQLLDARRMRHQLANDSVSLALSWREVAAVRRRVHAEARGRLVDMGIAISVDSLTRGSQPFDHVGLDQLAADVAGADVRVLQAEQQIRRLRQTALEIERVEAQTRLVEAQMREQRELARRSVLLAPASGIVVSQRGDFLAGTQVASGDGLFEIADLSRWSMVAFVSERDALRVQVGDSVSLQIREPRTGSAASLPARVMFVRLDDTGSFGADESSAMAAWVERFTRGGRPFRVSMEVVTVPASL